MTVLGPDYDQNWFEEYNGTPCGHIYKVDEQCQKLSPLGNESFFLPGNLLSHEKRVSGNLVFNATQRLFIFIPKHQLGRCF